MDNPKGSGDLLIAFPVQGWPVGHACIQQTDVDEVEVVFRIDPLAAAVVDLETKIGRCEVGLDR